MPLSIFFSHRTEKRFAICARVRANPYVCRSIERG